MASAERHFRRRMEALEKAVTSASSFDDAARAVLELGALWTPDVLAAILTDATDLAAWEGREAVFLDEEDVAFAVSSDPLIFREQIEFLRQKRPTPTKRWTDALRGDHDRAFVVAGITDLAMIEDIQNALIKAAKTGGAFEPFAKDFTAIAAKYGWTYDGDLNWRIRTILETNMRTSFMAGRVRQMREVVDDRPYWQYLHGQSRVPKMPRVDHVSWHNLILMWNDPWWDTHFPPNDWRCSCGVRSLSRRSLERMGKSGPDEAPRDALLPQIDKATGQLVMQPRGIGFGWDYMPGDQWDRGLVPSALIDEAGGLSPDYRQLVRIDEPEPLADLVARARPIARPLLQTGLNPDDYVRAFLEPFGADIGRAVMFTDVAGHRIPISDRMFRNAAGDLKVLKRGREVYAGLLAEVILDPDEIWLGLTNKPVFGDAAGRTELKLDRRYIRVEPRTGLLAVFEIGRLWWEAITAYPTDGSTANPYAGLDKRRGGKLIWKRK